MLDRKISDLVVENPRRARLFEQLKIDYCCHGATPLADACRERGLDPQAIVRQIGDCDQRPGDRQIDWREKSLTELCDHIEQTHHQWLREALPRVKGLLDKVVEAHHEQHPELDDVAQTFAAMENELFPHMMKEERVLFPMIRQLEQATTLPQFHCGTVQNPIRVMHAEHELVGEALARMRKLTGGFAPPEDACTTYRVLLDALVELEQDLHQHIHKENNLLFPRAAQLEHRLAGAT